ncbi:MAG: alpha/beta hydrolase family protein, partial [Caldilineales bacterium]
MALIQVNYQSDALGSPATVQVILPEPLRKSYPVLYLLHGQVDDQTVWTRQTSIERYVQPLGLAVVMPAVQRGWYTDMASGPGYFTFVADELPALVKGMFPISSRRKDTFVAGLSMGGYGAFKLALAHPERYAAAASLSGALDVVALLPTLDKAERKEWQAIFGNLKKVAGSDNDLTYLARQLARRRTRRPQLFQCCGTEDFLYDLNVSYRDLLKSLRIKLTYEDGAGEHDWSYWDRTIQRVL